MLSVGATSSAAMAGYAMGSALVLCSQYLFLRKINQGHQGSVDASARLAAEYVGVFLAFLGLWNVHMGSAGFRSMGAGAFSTTGDVGLYAVLFQLGTYPVAMATTMAMQLFIPILYQRAGMAQTGAEMLA